MSRAPVHPIPIIGTTVALDLDMPGYGHLAVGQEAYGVRVRGRGGKGQTGASPMPVSLYRPCGRFLWVSPECPAAKLDPGVVIEPFGDGLTHPNAVIVRPAANFGVELMNQLPLR